MKTKFFLLIFGFSLSGLAAEPTSIAGLWTLPQDGTLIEVRVENGKAQGFIVGRPNGREDEVDKNNPNKELRRRPILGLKVLRDLKASGDEWSGGTIYDPDSGSSYRATAQLKNDETLLVRGYVGIPLFGRSTTLNRTYIDRVDIAEGNSND